MQFVIDEGIFWNYYRIITCLAQFMHQEANIIVDLTLCHCCVIGLSRKSGKILNDIRKEREKKKKQINKISFSFLRKVKAMFLYIQHLHYRKT